MEKKGKNSEKHKNNNETLSSNDADEVLAISISVSDFSSVYIIFMLICLFTFASYLILLHLENIPLEVLGRKKKQVLMKVFFFFFIFIFIYFYLFNLISCAKLLNI
jgi:hypothetical protein